MLNAHLRTCAGLLGSSYYDPHISETVYETRNVMICKKLLIGSLSSDLYRVASLIQRDSQQAARQFFTEAQKWTKELQHIRVSRYIRRIIDDVHCEDCEHIFSLEKAEKFLMYGVLLQNYVLRLI